ncbi:Transcriptional regulator, TetR family [Devosia sp. DBB001]|nr:Transcriptional regulator, TetR family [Devosia sp. DBB001]
MSGERRIPNFRLQLRRPDMVLDAALDIFSRDGFEKGRMEDIARRAGVTKSAVYHHFPSKTAILEALIRRHCLPETPGATLEVILVELTLGKARAVLDLVLREYRNIPGLGRLYWDEAVRRVSERATTSIEEAESVVRAALSRTVVDRVFG